MVAAGAHDTLANVRRKLEETFGQFELSQTPAPHVGAEEGLVEKLSKAIDEHKLVEIEYLKPEEQEVATRTVEPYSIERRLPHWYVHTWDVDRNQPRSYRLDRMRKATVQRKRFAPREGFDPSELHGATTARIWYSPAVARWEVEKGARPLVDGAAIADKSVGSAEWLVGEVVSYRGEAIVLEPQELRARVALRARELANELRPSRSATSR
jgi:predicted DNA-binding transcriptional regulator YafY